MEIYRSSTVELDEMVALADSKAPQPETQVERPSSIFRPSGKEQAENKIETLMQQVAHADREIDLDRRTGVPRDRLIAQEGARLRLSAQLERLNVQTVGDIGERFDPRLHHAIAFEASGEMERGRILHVHQHGFVRKQSRFGVFEREQMLQPAMVTVSSGWGDAGVHQPHASHLHPLASDRPAPRPVYEEYRAPAPPPPHDPAPEQARPIQENPVSFEPLSLPPDQPPQDGPVAQRDDLFDKMFPPKPEQT